MSENQRDKFNDTEHERLFDAIKELKESTVSIDRFKPVESITYGLVGIMLVFMVGQVLNMTARGGQIISAIMAALGIA